MKLKNRHYLLQTDKILKVKVKASRSTESDMIKVKINKDCLIQPEFKLFIIADEFAGVVEGKDAKLNSSIRFSELCLSYHAENNELYLKVDGSLISIKLCVLFFDEGGALGYDTLMYFNGNGTRIIRQPNDERSFLDLSLRHIMLYDEVCKKKEDCAHE